MAYSAKVKNRIEYIVLAVFSVYCITFSLYAVHSYGGGVFSFLGDSVFILAWVIKLLGRGTYEKRAFWIGTCVLFSMCFNIMAVDDFFITVATFIIIVDLLSLFGLPKLILVKVPVTAWLILYDVLIKKTVSYTDGYDLAMKILRIVGIGVVEAIAFYLISAHTRATNELREALEFQKKIERSKDDFLANISHEIRTPLNTIHGMSEVLMEAELGDEEREGAEHIHTASMNLQSLVSDILDFTELQTGEIYLHENAYSITAVMSDVLAMATAKRGKKPVEIIVDCDPNIPGRLVGDDQKIQRAIMNIVGNAIKFTEKGCINIEVTYRREEYGINLIVSVEDTGIGMKPESLENIFSTYSQADTKRSRKNEGAGIGLAITKAMIDLMKGFISFKSEYGKGTKVQFVIPQKVLVDDPLVSVERPEDIRVLIYLDLDRFESSQVKEFYTISLRHATEQLGVDAHFCRSLAELKRRMENEKVTHVFMSAVAYALDVPYFDAKSKSVSIVAFVDKGFSVDVSGGNVELLYKPFYSFSLVGFMNDSRKPSPVATAQNRKFKAPRARVLVVDDVDINIKVVKGLLRSYKMTIDGALSGREAIEMVKKNRYDLVFMDHMMPEMDGVETFHEIKKLPGEYYKNLPIVALTANAVSGSRNMFMDEGFFYFVAKPAELTILDRVLRNALPTEYIEYTEEQPGAENHKSTGDDAGEEHAKNAASPDESGAAGASVTEADEGLSEERRILEGIEGLDVGAGVNFCGSFEDYYDVLNIQLDKVQETRDKIDDSFRNSDWENYTIFVHALKSTMKMLGIMSVSEQARLLELAGKKSDIDYIRANNDKLLSAYLSFMGGVRDKLPNQDGGAAAEQSLRELSDEEFADILNEFEENVYRFDADVLMGIANKLEGASFGGESLRPTLNDIRLKIENSDFLAANEVLAERYDKG